MRASKGIYFIGILALSACTHAPVQPLQQFEALKFSNALTTADFKQQSRKPYEFLNQYSFVSSAQWLLKISVDSDISPSQALEKIVWRRDVLKQNLLRQRDPYNVEPGNLACELSQFDQTNIDDNKTEIALQLRLKATKYYITDCYNSQSIYFDEVINFLYCKKNKSFFEIHFFSPQKDIDLFHLVNCSEIFTRNRN
jgi:hypothetical protein